MGEERIVITGYGVKVPGAGNREEFFGMLRDGKHDLTPHTTEHGRAVFIGSITESLDELSDRAFRRYPRFAKLASASTLQAIEMSGIKELDSSRTGIFMANSTGTPNETLQNYGLFNSDRKKRIPLDCSAQMNIHTTASGIAAMLKHQGITRTVATGCTAAFDAMEDAIAYMLSQRLDVAIVGGTESSISDFGIEIFSKTSLAHDVPLELSGSPFNRDSVGFVWSEGAGTVVLETENHALKRNAKIYGVVDTLNSNNDGYSIIMPEREGRAMQSVVERTLKNRIPDYINSQALGIQDNDGIEANWMRNLLGNAVPVTTVKGHVGHAQGAGSVIQMIASLITFEESFVFKTVRTDKRGFDEVNLVTNNLYFPVKSALITSHGLGGNNSAMFLTKYE